MNLALNQSGTYETSNDAAGAGTPADVTFDTGFAGSGANYQSGPAFDPVNDAAGWAPGPESVASGRLAAIESSYVFNNSARQRNLEGMLSNFTTWFGGQSRDVRQTIKGHLSNLPTTEWDTEKKRLVNMFAVSELTGEGLEKVSANWDAYRSWYASNRGGLWLDAAEDEVQFNALLAKDAERRRDERRLIYGLDENELQLDSYQTPGAELSEEDAKTRRTADLNSAWENSLAARVQRAAFDGVPYMKAVAAWQASVSNKPGYDPNKASQYLEYGRLVHQQMSQSLAKVAPIAHKAYDLIAKARTGQDGGDKAPGYLFRGLTPQEKQLAFQVMKERAGKLGEKRGEDFLELHAFVDAASRSFENLIVGADVSSKRSQLLNASFKEGDYVNGKDALEELRNRSYRPAIPSYNIMAGRGGIMPYTPPVSTPAPGRKLTAGEAKEWNEQLVAAREDLDTSEQLRMFGQQVIDPTRVGEQYFQDYLLPIADSTAVMVSMAHPALALGTLGIAIDSYQNDQYMRLLEETGDPKAANDAAFLIAFGQAAVERIPLPGVGRFAPRLGRKLDQFILRQGVVGRTALNMGRTFVKEVGEEVVQDDVIPALVLDNLSSDPEFDKSWGEVWGDIWKHMPEKAKGMVVMSGLGGLRETHGQEKFVETFTSSPMAMAARGYLPEQIAEIQAAPVSERGALLSEFLPAEAPKGAERDALIERVLEYYQEESETFAVKRAAETAGTVDAAAYAIRVTRNGQGWQVAQADGVTLQVESAEAARRIREELKQASSQREADALVGLIDGWHEAAPEGVSRETTLTGELARSDGGKISYSRDGAITREVTSEADLQGLRQQARMDAKLSGNEAMDVAVNGINYVGRIGHGARELYQRLEINRSPSAAMTFLHEAVEADWRAGIQGGAFSREETQRAIASIANAFDPKLGRDAEEVAFRERVQRVARGEANEIELRETLTELAVSDVLGRRRDGNAMPAGSVSATLDEAVRNSTNATEVRELGKLRAFFRAVRNHFRAVFGTVAALKKARREGGAAEFDSLVDRLFGRNWKAANEWSDNQAETADGNSPTALSDRQADISSLANNMGELPGGVKPEQLESSAPADGQGDAGAAYSLSREEDLKAAQALFGKPEQVLRESTRRDGLVVLNADNMVERSAEMKAARSISEGQSIHKRLQPMAAMARNAALDWVLEQPITAPDKLIILTAGGPGSGKSRSLSDIPGPRLVYDTNLGNARAATELIGKIIATGRKVEIRFVDRDFADAVRGNVERASDEKRLSTAQAIAKGHFDARRSMLDLTGQYVNRRSVRLRFLRNANELRWMTAEEFKSRPQPTVDQLKEQAYEIAYELERDPATSREALTLFRGEGGLGDRSGSGAGGIDPALQSKPGGSQTPGHQSGRAAEGEGADLSTRSEETEGNAAVQDHPGRRAALGLPGELSPESGSSTNSSGQIGSQGGGAFRPGAWRKVTGRARDLVIAAHKEVAAIEQKINRLKAQLDGPERRYRTMRETNRLVREITKLKADAVSRVLAIFRIPADQRGGKSVKLPGSWAWELGPLPFDAAAIIEDFVDPNLLPAIEEVINRPGREGHLNRKIYINPDTVLPTAVHEIMHAVEEQNPAVLAACKEFLARRAARGRNPEPQPLNKLTASSKYGAQEMGYEDEWALHGGSAYSGKVAPHGNYTEILTTGIGRFMRDPLLFAQQDPEFFSFVVNTLRP